MLLNEHNKNLVNTQQFVQAAIDRLSTIPVISGEDESIEFVTELATYGVLPKTIDDAKLLARAKNKDKILRAVQSINGYIRFPKKALFGDDYASVAENTIYAALITLAHYASTYGQHLHDPQQENKESLPVFEGLAEYGDPVHLAKKFIDVHVEEFDSAVIKYLTDVFNDKMLTTLDAYVLAGLTQVQFEEEVRIPTISNMRLAFYYPALLNKVRIKRVSLPIIRHIIKAKLSNPLHVNISAIDSLLKGVPFKEFIPEYLQHEKLYRRFFAKVEDNDDANYTPKNALSSKIMKYFIQQKNRESAYYVFRGWRGKYSKLEKAIKYLSPDLTQTIEPNIVLANLTRLLKAHLYAQDRVLDIVQTAAKAATPVMVVRAYNALRRPNRAEQIVVQNGTLYNTGLYDAASATFRKQARAILKTVYAERLAKFLQEKNIQGIQLSKDKQILTYAIPTKRTGDGKTLFPPLGSVITKTKLLGDDPTYISTAIEWKDKDGCTDFDLHTAVGVRNARNKIIDSQKLGWNSLYTTKITAGITKVAFSGDMTCAQKGAIEIVSGRILPERFPTDGGYYTIVPAIDRFAGNDEEYINAAVFLSSNPITQQTKHSLPDNVELITKFALPSPDTEGPLTKMAMPGIINVKVKDGKLTIEFVSLAGIFTKRFGAHTNTVISYADYAKKYLKIKDILKIAGIKTSTHQKDGYISEEEFFRLLWEFTLGVDKR